MKKFSTLTNTKVKVEEPKTQVVDETKKFKNAILGLMENTLKIRSYGSARTELLETQLKIDGKEMFVDALLDMVHKYSLDDKVSMLESLKYSIRDWKAIDDKIDEISSIDNNVILENKIKRQIEQWPDDVYLMAENTVSNINDKDYIEKIVAVCEKMEGEKHNYGIRHQLSIVKNVYKKRLFEIC